MREWLFQLIITTSVQQLLKTPSDIYPHQIIPRSSVEKASLQLLQLRGFHRTRIRFLLHQRLHAPIITGSTLCHTGVALCNSGHTA